MNEMILSGMESSPTQSAACASGVGIKQEPGQSTTTAGRANQSISVLSFPSFVSFLAPRSGRELASRLYRALELFHSKANTTRSYFLLVGRRVLGDGRVMGLRHGLLSNRWVAAGDHAGVAFEELVGLVCEGLSAKEFFDSISIEVLGPNVP
jgi:hypothetical protein